VLACLDKAEESAYVFILFQPFHLLRTIGVTITFEVHLLGACIGMKKFCIEQKTLSRLE